MKIPEALRSNQVTILAYGALLSEASSRLTFPDLQDFRYVRIWGMKRVFAHPHMVLLTQHPDLLMPDPACCASLSAEPGQPHDSFVAAAFTVVFSGNDGEAQRRAFVQREWTYDIVNVPYHDLEAQSHTAPAAGTGVLCVRSTDDKWPQDVAQLPANDLEVASIWHWPKSSGILPANVYLRHCLLAVEKAPNVSAQESFLTQTYLVDRKTTLKEFLSVHRDRVMASEPPAELATRFGG